MSRKITEQACAAFETGRKYCQSNTKVTEDAMLLWGHKIAFRENGKLFVSLCGWNSVTTRERLNGLTGVSVCSRNYTPYINGVEVSSNAIYEIKSNGEVVKA